MSAHLGRNQYWEAVDDCNDCFARSEQRQRVYYVTRAIYTNGSVSLAEQVFLGIYNKSMA